MAADRHADDLMDGGGLWHGPYAPLTPSADLPACRDEDPATPAVLAACYPDPPEYQHPDGDPQ